MGEFMLQQHCPECHEVGISRLRKLCLGPAIPTSCRKCGIKLGVPWWSVLVAIAPIILFMILFSSSGIGLVSIAVTTASFVLLAIIYLKWVPLVALNEENLKERRLTLYITIALIVLGFILILTAIFFK